ncbi:effector-associated constant component EACC1 [Streptomyces sp. 4N509B]|uniref:effector-associated constant component EACC1 n=1 Tax=Streptomyces sp. 4N509B TaxID=3457413 RepID=UPI003FD25916
MRIRIGDDGSADQSTAGDAAGAGASGAELTGRFAEWLARDRNVGRHVTLTRERSPAPDGAMSGDLLGWIGLTLSTGFSAANLIYSHLNFRASLPPRQRPAARMVIEYNGVRIVVEEGGPEDAARLARLLGTTSAPDGEGAGGGS